MDLSVIIVLTLFLPQARFEDPTSYYQNWNKRVSPHSQRVGVLNDSQLVELLTDPHPADVIYDSNLYPAITQNLKRYLFSGQTFENPFGEYIKNTTFIYPTIGQIPEVISFNLSSFGDFLSSAEDRVIAELSKDPDVVVHRVGNVTYIGTYSTLFTRLTYQGGHVVPYTSQSQCPKFLNFTTKIVKESQQIGKDKFRDAYYLASTTQTHVKNPLVELDLQNYYYYFRTQCTPCDKWRVEQLKASLEAWDDVNLRNYLCKLKTRSILTKLPDKFFDKYGFYNWRSHRPQSDYMCVSMKSDKYPKKYCDCDLPQFSVLYDNCTLIFRGKKSTSKDIRNVGVYIPVKSTGRSVGATVRLTADAIWATELGLLDVKKHCTSQSLKEPEIYDKPPCMKFIIRQPKNPKTSYVLHSNSIYKSLTFKCQCPYMCLLIVDTYMPIIVTDGRVIKTDTRIKDSVSIVEAFNNSRESIELPSCKRQTCTVVGESTYYEETSGGFLRVVVGSGPQVLTFVSSLTIIYQVPLGPLTAPYVYCVFPRPDVLQLSSDPQAPINAPLPQVVTFNDGTRLVERKINNTIIHSPDPVFVSSEVTLRPTAGSCKLPSGYKWAGSFDVVSTDTIQYCEVVEGFDKATCFSTKLEPKTKIYTVPKRILLPRQDCSGLCKTNICNGDERKSPLYQVCQQLTDSINQILGHTSPVEGVDLPLADNSNDGRQLPNGSISLKFFQNVVTKLDLEAKHNQPNFLRRFDKISKVFDLFGDKRVPLFEGFGKFLLPIPLTKNIDTSSTRFWPDRGDGFFEGLMYNTAWDMDWVAALPWLAGWRYGRQINALSFTMHQVLLSLKDLQTTINDNFDVVKEAFGVVQNQITHNFNAMSQLAQNVETAITALQNDVYRINQKLSQTEFMAAKVAQLNALYTDIKVMQERLLRQQAEFRNRVKMCNRLNAVCMDMEGVYLSHNSFETEDFWFLVVKYLGAEECRQVYQRSVVCVDGGAKIAAFPCTWQKSVRGRDAEWQLVNLNNVNQSCPPTIQLDSCRISNSDAFTYAMDNAFSKPLERHELNLTTIEFHNNLGNISEFGKALNETLNKIKDVTILQDHFNDTTFGGVFTKAAGGGMTFWTVVFLIIFLSVLACICAPIVRLCFIMCCNKNK
ncbi:spike protein [Veiled chameleon serpentovirus B]|uniref:Spike protein n=1 Tax=Veiled chameleon serpentovirus B TaxID=2806430 RepID=A0AAE7PG44_9NIDO|nr:spike protein [Veiled chameleon serpentovirus B]QRC47042.1 spike protein [Veiled chameleon serpentovirus B]